MGISPREKVLALFVERDRSGSGLICRAALERLLLRLLDVDASPELSRVLDDCEDAEAGSIPYRRFLDWVYAEPPGQLEALEPPCPSPTEAEESELLGVSVAFLTTGFLAEVEQHFGRGEDPNYYQVNAAMLYGPEARGADLPCPRDGRWGCSYVDALPRRDVGRATVMLSWSWGYTVQTVVTALARWCERGGADPARTFVWQCALCCNQFRVEERKARGEWEPFEHFRAVFERRVRSIGHVLALLAPWEAPVYIGRMWCVFEFHMALQVEGCCLEIVLPDIEEARFSSALAQGGMGSVWGTYEKVQIQRAKTSSPHDRANILRLVDPEADGDCEGSRRCAALNAEVVKRLQSWFVASAVSNVEAAGQHASVDACVNVARLLMEIAEWDEAMRVLEIGQRCLEGADGAGSARLLRTMGSCLGEQGLRDEALDLYERAREGYASAGVAGHEYAGLLSSMAVQLSLKGSNEQVVPLYREAKDVYEALGETSSVDYAQLLTRMGAHMGTHGQHEDAMALNLRAKAAYEEAGATHGPDYAVLLKSIGTLLGTQGRNADAIVLYQEAKAAFEAMGATEKPDYANLLKNMGVCMGTQQRYEEAMQYYLQSKAAYEAAGATSRLEYASLLKNMGVHLGTQKRNREAMELYRQAQATYEEAEATTKPEYAVLLKAMGVCLDKQGCQAEAMEIYEQARAAYESASATRRPDYAALLRQLASAKQRRGEDPLELYEQAKAAYEQAGATSRLDYGELLKSMAMYLGGVGRFGEAMELFEQAKGVFLAAGAAGRNGYACLLGKIALHYHSRNMHSEALTLATEAKEAYTALGKTGTPEYAALANIMDEVSKTVAEEAERAV